MKLHLAYGLAIAVSGAVLMLLLYLFGFYSSPEKLGLAQGIGGIGAVVISAAGIFLGQRARRESTPSQEAFSYGQAFGTGWKIAFFATLFGTVFNALYFSFINTEFSEVVVQSQIAKLEAQGKSGAQIETAEKMIRMMTTPKMLLAAGLINSLILGTLLSLLTAGFTKRPALKSYGEPPALGT